jgi:hypothetical protein
VILDTCWVQSPEWSCLSFVDTFRLWSEGVHDAEEQASLPAGAAA